VLGPLGDATPQLLHPARELVAQQLERSQAEQARAGGHGRRVTSARADDGSAGRGWMLRGEVRKRLGDDC